MSLAENVVRRFLADTIVDPKEGLAKFREHVVEFCKREEFAKSQLPVLKRFIEMIASGTSNVQVPGESQDLSVIVNKGQSERYDLKWNLRDGFWFKRARNDARRLFWGIVQQFALPPQLQKSIEAANKYWSKERASVRTKAMKGTYDEDVEILASYLKTCAELQKQLANAEAAVVKGVLHSDPAQAAKTKFAAGPFMVVNTGGFDDDTMKKAVEIVLKAEKAMTSAGLGKCCYGDALVSNRLQKKGNVAAFYLPSSDEFFVRADLPDDSNTIQYVCHELAHRLDHKFLHNKKSAMITLYAQLRREDEEREDIPVSAYPRVGEEYTVTGPWAEREPGKTVKVKAINTRKKTVQYFVKGEFGYPSKVFYEIPLQSWWVQFKGENLEVQAKPAVLGKFVSHYAKTGGPDENFAEMVAYYVLGKLPEGQVKPLEEILFG